MQQVALGLLDDPLRHCLMDAAGHGLKDSRAKLDELSLALHRAVWPRAWGAAVEASWNLRRCAARPSGAPTTLEVSEDIEHG